MENFEIELINNDTFLLVPINGDIPLSTIVDMFNQNNTYVNGNIIIDLLVYVGNRQRRFKICKLINRKIEINMLTSYTPSNDIIEKSYVLFSKAPDGLINRIINPCIRDRILNLKKN